MKIEDVRPKRWYSLEDYDGEEWRAVPGYNGYLVSNYGRVKSLFCEGSLKRKCDKIMKERFNKSNHCCIQLYRDGKYKTTFVHRIVALAFLPNPNNYPIINHKDEVPYNNHVSNIEWCTYKYNSNYGNIRSKISNSLKGHEGWNAIPVAQYDIDGNFVQKYKSIKDACKILGYKSKSSIHEICEGKKNCTAYGFQWKYIKDNPDYEKNIGHTKRKYTTKKKPVFQYDMNMNFIASYASACDAARALKIGQSGINSCCNKKLPHSHHFLWFYKKQH